MELNFTESKRNGNVEYQECEFIGVRLFREYTMIDGFARAGWTKMQVHGVTQDGEWADFNEAKEYLNQIAKLPKFKSLVEVK